MKKYEFTGETQEHEGKILHQIRAIRDFDNASKGDIGGWIASEYNLSHEGLCWVEKEAIVMGDAIVRGDAYVEAFASISGNALVENDSRIGAYARIDGQAHVEYGSVGEHAHISGKAHIACGQDGPPIYPYSAIDFGVEYGSDYFLIAAPYSWDGLYFSISQSGRIAFQEWEDDAPRLWSGNLAEFEKKIAEEYVDYEEVIVVGRLIRKFLQGNKKS